MAVYCVDDGGDGSQDGATQSLVTLDWSKADTSFANLPAGALSTAGNVVFVGDDHGNSTTGADQTIAGPSSGLSLIIISADRTQVTPTYKKGTGNQFNSTDGAYNIVFNGTFALYGICINSGKAITFEGDQDESFFTSDCTLKPGNGSNVNLSGGNATFSINKNLTVDLTNDTGATSAIIMNLQGGGAICDINGLTISNADDRTGAIFSSGISSGCYLVSGADLSAVPAAVEILNNSSTHYVRSVFNNCLTAATAVIAGIPGYTVPRASCYNIGSEDLPTYTCIATGAGILISTTIIYRTGGGDVEGVACGWLVTTSAVCSENHQFQTDWFYKTIDTTGSKTFDVYITNDTADFTDAEVWLEVEYFETDNEAQWTLITDQRASITATAAAQTDDVASTWNGAGPSFTYKQKLSVTATIGETGQFRARVCVGKANIGSASYFYIDPKVTVS